MNFERTSKRSDINFARRNIEEILNPTCSKEINNEKKVEISEKNRYISRKSSKEEYTKKFLAWKAQKRVSEAEQKKTSIKKPFYTAVSSNSSKDVKETKNVISSIKGKTVTTERKTLIPKPKQRIIAPLPLPNIAVVSSLKKDNMKENQAKQKNHLLKTEKWKRKSIQMARKTSANILKEKHNNNNNAQKINVKTKKKCVVESNAPKVVGTIPSKFMVSTVKKPSGRDRFFPIENNTISPIEGSSSHYNENEDSARKRKRPLVKVNDDDNDNDHKIKSPFKNKFQQIPKIIQNENKADPLGAEVEESMLNTTANKIKNHRIDHYTPLKVESDNCNGKENTCNNEGPYLLLSLGKRSGKKEKENFYNFETSRKETEKSVCDRQIHESVKYFRKMIQNETQRLRELCSLWEDHKSGNKQLLEENGDGLNNVSISQTIVLLRKKFQQFDDLINRCENVIGVKETDICNEEQRIYLEDLEEFWAIIKNQIDNINTRFENLNKTEANDWNDPQEVKVKEKQVLNMSQKSKLKKHKGKSRPHTALLEDLRKTQAAYKKNKQLNPNVDNNVMFFIPEKDTKATNKICNSSPASNAESNSFRNLNTQFTNTNAAYIEPGITNNLLLSSNQSFLEEITETPMKKRSYTPLIQLQNIDMEGELTQPTANNFSSCSIRTKKEKPRNSVSSNFTNFVTPRKSSCLNVMKNYTEETGLTPHHVMPSWINRNYISCSPKPNNSNLKSNRLNSQRARKSILKTPGHGKPSHLSVLSTDHTIKSPLSTSGSEYFCNSRNMFSNYLIIILFLISHLIFYYRSALYSSTQ